MTLERKKKKELNETTLSVEDDACQYNINITNGKMEMPPYLRIGKKVQHFC